MDKRIEIAREVAMSYIGTYYKWGGDDPSGFDCSGFVIEILKSVGLMRRHEDTTAARLFKMFHESGEGDLGNLVYYKNSSGRICHVEFCLGYGLSIGASGGGRNTINYKIAIEQNAFIKIRPYGTRARMAGFNDPFIRWRDA
jgi:D-gamma-glutamyl-meso-diaminopimelic acid endopeptidase CwlS